MPPASTPAEVIDHLRRGDVRPGGSHGTASTALAQSVGTLLLKRYANDGAAAIPEQLRGPFADLIAHPLGPIPAGPPAGTTGTPRIAKTLLSGARRDRTMRRTFKRLGRLDDSPQRSRERLRFISGWLHAQLMRSALSSDDLTFEESSGRIEALMAASAVAAPYCLAARWMRDEREHAVGFERDYFGAPGVTADGPVRVAVFTDTFDQLNGVAGTMRRLAAWSAEQPERPVTVVTNGRPGDDTATVAHMFPVTEAPVPAYADSGLRLGVPSLLDVMDVIDRTGARIVHAATPGPMGIAALLAARTLGLPFVASYHTELGDYAMQLTGDRIAAGLTRKAVRWFYGQAERVYVPTGATGRRLADDGVDPDRLHGFGRGIDTEAFAPRHRDRWMRRRMGGGESVVVLYVGRISREKGLDTLATAFRDAARADSRLRLVLVGDGPHRDDLARRLRGTPHRFMGALTGTALSTAFASADIFCLPSATETYGQVVMEASASGLPVIVTDAGGAQELVENGRTGLVVPADRPGDLSRALLRLGSDEVARNLMGAAGRHLAANRAAWPQIFSDLIANYADLLHSPHRTTAPAEVRQPRTTAEAGRS
ncbi:MAG: glycosyltransferase family 1 protein [Thermoleophilia bacterium]